MTKWQKILIAIAGGLGAVSAVVPGVNLVTLPLIGAVTLKAALVGAGTFLTGVAIRSDTIHGPVAQPPVTQPPVK